MKNKNIVIPLFLIVVVALLILVLIPFFLKKDKPVNQVDDSFKDYPLNTTIGYHVCSPGGSDCLSEDDLQKVLGKKEDLIAFSFVPDGKVSGKSVVQGIIKGGYFFEGNILINILDSNKNLLKQGHATATTNWMTSEDVSFEGEIDFTGLSAGPAYIEIHNDNASGLPENDKSILIPVIIK